MTRARLAATWPFWLTLAALYAPALCLGHIPGDSGKYNVVWLTEFSDKLFSGTIYPRWLSGLRNGLGGADFWFYGPLPFYLGAPFAQIAGPKLAMALTSLLMTLLSGLSMAACIRRRGSRDAAILAGIVYMAAPYHMLAAVMTRNAIGEQAAYIFMPLALLAADRLPKDPRAVIWLALAVAGLILSHLATTLLFAPLLIAYCLHIAWRARAPDIIVRATLAAGLAAALTAAYTLPALTLSDMIRTEFWDLWSPTSAFLFVAGNDLSRIPAGYALVLHLSAGLTLALIAGAAVGLIWTGRYGLLAFWGGAQVIYIFLNTPLSAPLWRAAEVFDRIQFPWRSFTVMEVMLAVMLAAAIGAYARRVAIIAALSLAGLSGTALMTGQITYDRLQVMPYGAAVEDALIARRWAPQEYLPACMTHEALTASTDLILEGRKGGAPFYYPFLQTRDGAPVACDPDTGRIANYDAEKGLKVSAPPVARVGYALTLAALAMTFLALWRLRSGQRIQRGE